MMTHRKRSTLRTDGGTDVREGERERDRGVTVVRRVIRRLYGVNKDEVPER